MTATIRVRNWAKWQSYRRDRGQPPWIKVHRQLMRDPNWVALSDAQRGHLVSLWLLAADRNGELPDDPKLLMKLCYLDSEPDVDALIDAGFIEPRRQHDAKPTPARRQRDAPETETETETETEKKDSSRQNGARVPSRHIDLVFQHWQQTFEHNHARCTEKRRRLIAARLKDYSLDELRECISGYKLSPFHAGHNDRAQVYDSLELILRDEKHVEQGLAFKKSPPEKPQTNGRRKTRYEEIVEQQQRDMETADG